MGRASIDQLILIFGFAMRQFLKNGAFAATAICAAPGCVQTSRSLPL